MARNDQPRVCREFDADGEAIVLREGDQAFHIDPDDIGLWVYLLNNLSNTMQQAEKQKKEG